jgi:hypothetical protein
MVNWQRSKLDMLIKVYNATGGIIATLNPPSYDPVMDWVYQPPMSTCLQVECTVSQ